MKKADIVLSFFILLLGISVLWFYRGQAAGTTVEIRVDGTLYGTYSLSEDRTVPIQTVHGKNVVEIRDGFVYVSDSDCKDKLEMRAGKIYQQGEHLICLPNRLVITVSGKGTVERVSY